LLLFILFWRSKCQLMNMSVKNVISGLLFFKKALLRRMKKLVVLTAKVKISSGQYPHLTMAAYLDLTVAPLRDLVEDKRGTGWFQTIREDKEMVLRIVAGIIAGGVIGLLYSFLLQRVSGG